ncbi:nucleotide exchange factor GrpE [[Phormidium] sp. ETS-05]|uniref:nucleotide exchange factor GrpE n=1 Tax=[Phormidium] sp. ETS-05 TaxID=222819 RepID=UPI001E5D60B3|nr:nucleotide exchange factor GrpE [[Phormidium] sp. ETS-05]
MMEEEKDLENQNQPNATPPESSADSAAAAETDQAVEAGDRSGGKQPAADPVVGSRQPEEVAAEEMDFFDPLAIEGLIQANEQLKAQLEQAQAQFQAQFEDLKSQYARLGADFDNYRRRTEKEKEEMSLQAKAVTIKELLPVVDNFERARSQIKPQNDSEMNIHKSYQSVYKLLVDCLKRLGVAAMYPKGQEFDPNLHEAVMREATSEHPEGTVLEEFMRGYMLGDRILRHAMVKVATAPEPVITSEETQSESPQE